MSKEYPQYSKIIEKISLASGVIACNECDLFGDITIGRNTMIHPKALIVAEAGPIVIGEYNLIEERVHIMHLSEDGTYDPENVMRIGSFNTFEMDCYSAAPLIGDHNIIEPKVRLGKKVQLTNGCMVGAMCELTCTEVIPENTVIFSDYKRRLQQESTPTPISLIEFLAKILPNYHHLKKSTRVPKESKERKS